MLDRRALLVTGVAAAFVVVKPAAAFALGPERKIFLANPHTGETFHDVYWADGDYIPESLRGIDVLMRDHTTDEIRHIAPELIDVLARLRQKVGFVKPIQVNSGYRSPRTNAAVRRHNRHVARNSFHMQGMAVDISVPSFNLGKLRRAAIDLQAGGVGSYPDANFLHLDVGPVRVWTS
jgi:uncharacterized protein YcbK (DUF882 family)